MRAVAWALLMLTGLGCSDLEDLNAARAAAQEAARTATAAAATASKAAAASRAQAEQLAGEAREVLARTLAAEGAAEALTVAQGAQTAELRAALAQAERIRERLVLQEAQARAEWARAGEAAQGAALAAAQTGELARAVAPAIQAWVAAQLPLLVRLALVALGLWLLVELARQLSAWWLKAHPVRLAARSVGAADSGSGRPVETCLDLAREGVSPDRTSPPKNRATLHFHRTPGAAERRVIVLGLPVLSRRHLEIEAVRSGWRGLWLARWQRRLWWVSRVSLGADQANGDLVLTVGDPSVDVVRVILQPGQALGMRLDSLVAYDASLQVHGQAPGGLRVRLAALLCGYGWTQTRVYNPTQAPGEVVLWGHDLRRRFVEDAAGDPRSFAVTALAAWTGSLALELRGNVALTQALWAWVLSAFARLPIPVVSWFTGLLSRLLAGLVRPPVEWLSVRAVEGSGVLLIEQSPVAGSAWTGGSGGRRGGGGGAMVQVNLVQVG